MQYWLNIDSLALVCYAIILISVVLGQREKLMNVSSYFKFTELFSFGGDEENEEFDPTYDVSMENSKAFYDRSMKAEKGFAQ